MSDPYLPDIYPNTIGEDAYDALAPVVARWGDPGEFLWVYVNGIALMLKQVDDISRDGPNGEPGWSQIFDLERMKTGWLPWAGQIVGYAVPSRPSGQSLASYDAEQRERMKTRASWRNGTNDILYDVIAEQLNDPKRVIIQNRVGGNANRINVWVYDDDIATSAAEVEKVARANKAIGLVMTFEVLVGGDYETLLANSPTYQDVYTTFSSYSEVATHPEYTP